MLLPIPNGIDGDLGEWLLRHISKVEAMRARTPRPSRPTWVIRSADAPRGRGAARGLLGRRVGLLLGDGGADLIHIGVANGLDQLLEALLGEGARLGVEDDTVADRQERGDRGDLEDLGQAVLSLGVDLGEDDVGVCVAHLLEDRGELTARPAPRGPEVDEDDGAALDCGGERLFGERNGRHTPQGITRNIITRHDGPVLETTTIGRPADPPEPGLLLVAAPNLEEPFHQAVILLIEHDESGTLGVVLNQPTTLDVASVLPGWRDHLTGTPHLFQGGPVALDSALGLAALDSLVRDPEEPEGFRRVVGPLGIIDLDVPADTLVPHLQALRIYAGYAGWSPGQLDDELDRGSWAVVAPGDLVSDAFLADPEQLWAAVLRRAGGTLAWWPGHPGDPELN